MHFLVCDTWQFSVCVLGQGRLGVLFTAVVASDDHLIRLMSEHAVRLDCSRVVMSELILLELTFDIRRFVRGQA